MRRAKSIVIGTIPSKQHRSTQRSRRLQWLPRRYQGVSHSESSFIAEGVVYAFATTVVGLRGAGGTRAHGSRSTRSGARRTALDVQVAARAPSTGANSRRGLPLARWGNSNLRSISTDSKAADVPPIQFAYQAVPAPHREQRPHDPGQLRAGQLHHRGRPRYELKQVHFHHPSEEKIDGKASAMVAHLVHASAAGKLAVVAVLLDPGSANAFDRARVGTSASARWEENRRPRRQDRRRRPASRQTAATTRSPDR